MIENLIIQQDIDFFVGHFPFVEQIKEKTILVTGATGLIGSCIIDTLLYANVKGANFKIYAMSRTSIILSIVQVLQRPNFM